MSMSDWAKEEVALACKRENPNWDGKTFDYGCACYQSALKAYETLMKDGHSGMSFNLTKNILIRMMSGLPLVPIEDKDFFNENGERVLELEPEDVLREKGLKSHMQCPRMSSLFRTETLDGDVSYSDIDRQYGIDIVNGSSFHSGTISKLVNSMFPIKMPYYPSDKCYKVICEEFLTDKKNGDFDTLGLFYVITPDMEKIPVNRFGKEENGKWIDITKEEYDNRRKVSYEHNPSEMSFRPGDIVEVKGEKWWKLCQTIEPELKEIYGNDFINQMKEKWLGKRMKVKSITENNSRYRMEENDLDWPEFFLKSFKLTDDE